MCCIFKSGAYETVINSLKEETENKLCALVPGKIHKGVGYPVLVKPLVFTLEVCIAR